MSKQVMIVDDDLAIRVAVSKVLEFSGLEPFGAEGGKECLGYLEDGFKGLILMDIMMPEMDGWETVKEIVDQGYHEGNVIVMLTAKESVDKSLEQLQPYVADYLRKPIEGDQLVETIQQYLTCLDWGQA